MYSLRPITSGTGQNLGGICRFYFAPKEWLANDVVIDPASGYVKTAVTLIAGKEWLLGECQDQSQVYTEEDVTSSAGTGVSCALAGRALRDALARHLNLKRLRYHELVVICYDRNGACRIVGDKKKAMTPLTKFTAGEAVKDANIYALNLTHQMTDPAPYYMPTGITSYPTTGGADGIGIEATS